LFCRDVQGLVALDFLGHLLHEQVYCAVAVTFVCRLLAGPLARQGSKPGLRCPARRAEALERRLAVCSGRSFVVLLSRSVGRPFCDVFPGSVQFTLHLFGDGRSQVSFAFAKVLRIACRQGVRIEKFGVLVRRSEQHGGVAEGRRVSAFLVPKPCVQLLHKGFAEQLPSVGGNWTQVIRSHHLVRQRFLASSSVPCHRELLVRLQRCWRIRSRGDVEHSQRLCGV
ncbi:unnamed protein product, partial [Ectocarpus sp. 4 AP-2014]